MIDDEIEMQVVALVGQFMCFVFCWYFEYKCRLKNFRTTISREIRIEAEKARDDLMRNLSRSYLGHNIIRMSTRAFMRLCDILVKNCGLIPTIHATVEEQVAKTLHVFGHNSRKRMLAFFFRRSTETSSRHFHKVLEAILRLEEKYMKQLDGLQIPEEIANNDRFFPFFKDCIGAIDGTHISVKVSKKHSARYRGRKEHTTQNVIAACSFDLKFTYVLSGWEGTAPDSRVLKDALNRENRLEILEGKFYLVDAGFMLRSGLITPYRGVRYHLKEYSRKNPQTNALELFNLRHSSLRNAIKHAFGVIKKRFAILEMSESRYRIHTQKLIICACCILHNYLRDIDGDDEFLTEVDAELANKNPEEDALTTILMKIMKKQQGGAMLRDLIAADMWISYN